MRETLAVQLGLLGLIATAITLYPLEAHAAGGFGGPGPGAAPAGGFQGGFTHDSFSGGGIVPGTGPGNIIIPGGNTGTSGGGAAVPALGGFGGSNFGGAPNINQGFGNQLKPGTIVIQSWDIPDKGSNPAIQDPDGILSGKNSPVQGGMNPTNGKVQMQDFKTDRIGSPLDPGLTGPGKVQMQDLQGNNRIGSPLDPGIQSNDDASEDSR